MSVVEDAYTYFAIKTVSLKDTKVISWGSPCAFRSADRYREDIYSFSWRIPKVESPFWDQFDTFFFAIPKTGSHGLGKKINRYNFMGHLFGCQYPERIRHKLRTIVRNPYDRLVSAYYFMIRGGFNNNPYYLKVKEDYRDFADWVLNGLNPEYFEIEGRLDANRLWTEAFLPQSEWLLDEIGELVLDEEYIGKYENLVKDAKQLLNINLNTHLNKSNDRCEDWRIYFTNRKVREKVEKLYKKDFELLKYCYYIPSETINQEMILKRDSFSFK